MISPKPGRLPDARPLSQQNVLSGREHGQWVSLHGIGRSVTAIPGGVELRMATDVGISRVIVAGVGLAPFMKSPVMATNAVPIRSLSLAQLPVQRLPPQSVPNGGGEGRLPRPDR